MPDTDPSDVDVPGSEIVADGPDGAVEGEGAEETKKGRYDARVRAERDTLKAQNEALASQLAAVRRQEVLRRAGEHLRDPSDLGLVLTGEEVAAMWSEDGLLDEGVLAAAIDRALTERPHWAKPVPDGAMHAKPAARSSSRTAEEAFAAMVASKKR